MKDKQFGVPANSLYISSVHANAACQTQQQRNYLVIRCFTFTKDQKVAYF
jgi:hypothetical protein